MIQRFKHAANFLDCKIFLGQRNIVKLVRFDLQWPCSRLSRMAVTRDGEDVYSRGPVRQLSQTTQAAISNIQNVQMQEPLENNRVEH